MASKIKKRCSVIQHTGYSAYLISMLCNITVHAYFLGSNGKQNNAILKIIIESV